MTPEAYALEVKRSRTFRGQRMSAAQRRRAATVGNQYYTPGEGQTHLVDRRTAEFRRSSGGGRMHSRSSASMYRDADPNEINLGPKAKRQTTGRAARSRRLSAAGSFAGLDKGAARRMAETRREREKLMGARASARSYLNRRRQRG